MKTVTVSKAKIRFGELLDHVTRGEEIVITRYKKPVARLVPVRRPKFEHNPQRVVAEFRALRLSMAQRVGYKPLTDREIKKSVEQGRP